MLFNRGEIVGNNIKRVYSLSEWQEVKMKMTGVKITKECAVALIMLLAFFLPAIGMAQRLEKTPSAAKNDKETALVPSESLPSMNQLMESKFSALNGKLSEQEVLLAQAQLALSKERLKESQIFDSQAYLSLSIINSAPPSEYRLEHTEVFLDGRIIARGGKRNLGLPRNNEQIFFGPVAPGCHEVLVKAQYVRLKNNVIGHFKDVERIERLARRQTFIAQNSYRVELEIEGFEAQNTFLSFYRGPELRFNRAVRPNFLPNASLISMDNVLKQGRVHIDYLTENSQNSRLIEKSLSIDGLPILSRVSQNASDANVVFDAPLAEGKHTLNVVLLFGDKKRVGGPHYNFRLNFNRTFYVMSGQSTIINLVGMPKDGFRSTPEQSRFARATSKILAQEHAEFFPPQSCDEIRQNEGGFGSPNTQKSPTEAKPVKSVAPPSVAPGG